MEMELDLNAVVETAAAVRCDDSAASSALNAASGTVEASAGGSTPWQQEPMALTFTMLRPDDGGGTPGQQQLVTQELFPVMPPGRSGGSGLWERAGVVEQAAKKKSRRGPRSRSSEYRGVTFYRRTSRWESHIWDCGKQVYLGGFDTAHAAARAYDRAAIKFRGMGADINFNVRDYDEDMKQMKQLSKEEVVRLLRRRQMTAGCLSRGRYDCGRCMGGGHGVYLGGLVRPQVEAARASYDKAAIKCNGREAGTNLEPASIYDGDHDEIMLNQLHTQQAGVDVDLDLSISQPSGSPYRPKTETKRKGSTAAPWSINSKLCAEGSKGSKTSYDPDADKALVLYKPGMQPTPPVTTAE